MLQERDYFKPNPEGCTLTFPYSCQSDTNPPNYAAGSSCVDSSVYQPPIPLNLTLSDIDCTASDGGASEGSCFYDYCQGQSAAIAQASTVMSIPYIISASLSPFLGGFADRFGKRAIIATIAPAALIVVHSLLGLATQISPVGPLVGQGLAYAAFAAVLWPSVPLVVEQRFIGLGYGVSLRDPP